MAGKTNTNELARRYVTAVYELAGEGKKLSKLTSDLEVLGKILETSKDFQRMTNSPIVDTASQIAAIEEVGKKSKFGPITTNFLKVVATNGRLDVLPEILKAYKAKIAEQDGEITAEITSSVKLTAAVVKNIQSELSKKTKKKVIVTENVDPSIIGGLLVKIGSKMYDFSVKSQLNKIRNELKQAS